MKLVYLWIDPSLLIVAGAMEFEPMNPWLVTDLHRVAMNQTKCPHNLPK
jgi:hypothetical protein